MKKLILFGVGLVLLLFGFSYFGGSCLNDCTVNKPKTNVKDKTISLQISGMTCPDCAITIRHNLLKDKGIVSSNITYSNAMNTVTFNPQVTNTKEISGIIKATGFNIKLLDSKLDKNKESFPSGIKSTECK